MASNMDPNLAAAIIASAGRLGIDPVHLGTAISYETGGKFDPGLWGGAGGRHLGLIQFGPEERAKYGVKEGQSAVEQMGAVENYLRDRGVKPGMGLPDVYSTINAGSPGRFNARDANNGGAPGTVMDKVTSQMAGHEENARRLLGGQVGALAGPPVGPVAPAGSGAPIQLTPEAAPPAPTAVGALASVGSALSPQSGGPQAAPVAPEFLAPQQLAMAQPRTGQSQQIAATLAQLYGMGK